jgi:hypothetical protein
MNVVERVDGSTRDLATLESIMNTRAALEKTAKDAIMGLKGWIDQQRLKLDLVSIDPENRLSFKFGSNEYRLDIEIDCQGKISNSEPQCEYLYFLKAVFAKRMHRMEIGEEKTLFSEPKEAVWRKLNHYVFLNKDGNVYHDFDGSAWNGKQSDVLGIFLIQGIIEMDCPH